MTAVAVHRPWILLAPAALVACAAAAPDADPGPGYDPALPQGFQRAGYIPEWPEPRYPVGTGPADVIVRDGCFYLWQNGRVVALPFAERIVATGAVSVYDRYCIG